MSLDATRWAWQQDLEPSRKLVLLALADRADEANQCFPSIARLEKDTGLHRQTIMDAIAHLERIGLLKAFRRNGAGSRYQLLGVPDRHGDTGAGNSTGMEKRTGTGKRTQTSTENRTATSTKNRTENLPVEPTKESTKEITKEKRQDDAEILLEVFGITGQLAADFLAHRKSKKAPITETALKGLEREAKAAGITTAEAAAISIERNWQGFKAEWHRKAPAGVQSSPGLSSTNRGHYEVNSRFDNSAPGKVERAYAERRAARAAEDGKAGAGGSGVVIELDARDYRRSH